MAKLVQIVLNDRIDKHIRVHGRDDDFLASAGHHRRREHIVCNAICDLSDHISTGRRDHHHVRKLSKGHVLHTVLKIPVKCINQTLIAGESLKRNRMNEILRILSHQYMDVRLQLFQSARKRRDLVGRDTACHSKNHCLSFQHHLSPFFQNCSCIIIVSYAKKSKPFLPVCFFSFLLSLLSGNGRAWSIRLPVPFLLLPQARWSSLKR